MRNFFISALGMICYVVFVAYVALGVLIGGNAPGEFGPPVFSIPGAIIGGVVGLILGILTVGVIFVLLDMRASLKKLENRLGDR